MAGSDTKCADIDDVRIAFREHGSGPALILLHGNSQNKNLFAKYQKVHFPKFRTIALDTRGHGESEVGDQESFGFDRFSDDVIALCRTNGIKKAFVVGYSDGGNIALFLAKKAPDLFPALVAISPNYLVSGATEGTLRLTRMAVRLMSVIGKLGLSTRKAVLRLNLMLKDIGISAGELASIRTRMLILHAERDMIREEHIQEMGRLIPGASIQKIGHCNHLTILYKNETIQAIRDFLDIKKDTSPLVD